MPLPIIEPFRIKSVEPLRRTTREERREILRQAKYNLFNVHARDVLIDLLTDSGTAAMSNRQWAALMLGDESYAGSESYYRLKAAVDRLTGLPHLVPTHQGRAAEKILFQLLGGPGKVFLSNTFFDTTRANIEFTGAVAVDCVAPEAADLEREAPFKGNIDLGKMAAMLAEHAGRVAACILTVTNNSAGGQPVSLQNIRDARALLDRHGIPLYLDACRFAENAYFIKLREPGHADRSALEIAREMFSRVAGATFSGKKDALANMGGFLALRDGSLAEKARNLLTITEGFPTYGGMSGRDLDAMAAGLEEVLDEDYLEYRIASTAWTARGIKAKGVPIVNPPGGHAVYVDATAWLDHLAPEQLPGQALVNGLYEHYGIRTVEIGTVMFGKRDPATGALIPAARDLVRFAIPRRVYTQTHMEYVVEAMGELGAIRRSLPGYRAVTLPDFLPHFTAEFAPIA
ncbi:MAG: tryptophanase [Planctomycetes bacterium]|nr:tryptophanase [Planctomycetota bacterium]